MTDRVNTLTVVLERPIRTDDVQSIMDAILHIRGVQSVTTGEVDSALFGARTQERSRLRREILRVFDGDPGVPHD
jgi:hypothetical protein